jgi:hypothetical protein
MQPIRLWFIGMVIPLLASCGWSVLAADVNYYRLTKTQYNLQTSSNAPVASVLSFRFSAQLWESTNFSVNTATLTIPSFGTRSLFGSGFPLVLSSQASYATKSFMDTFSPTGTYTFSINSAHGGATNLTLTLPAGTYPVTPHINNQPALQSIDPSAPFMVSWDSYADGTTDDLIELQIWNSAGLIFASGAYPAAPGALNGQNTSTTVPANTLTAGRSYIGRLTFMHVVSTNYAYAPGLAAYAQQTDFYLSTTGAVPPVLVSAVPAIGVSNVPANAKIAFTFNKPMRPGGGRLTIGITNATSSTWSADQKTITFTSQSLWPSNVTQSWYINYFFNGLPSIGDTNDSPVMAETLATIFTGGTNTLVATPVSPLQQVLGLASNGVFQVLLAGGEAYRSYELQASSDLVHWDALDTIIATNSSFIFTDPAPPPTNRSYRILAIP